MTRPRWLLATGIATGALAAALGLRAPDLRALPDDAAARVGTRTISRDDFLRAVAAVESDRRAPLDDAERRRVLDRLVDEELLVQRALAQGLAESDARVRSTLVSEVMLSTGLAARPAFDEAALRAHYAEHPDRFSPAARLQLRARRIVDGAPRAFEPAPPDGLLPPAKLEAYLGPSLTQAALAMQPGETRRLDGAGGLVELTVIAREPGAAPPFEAVREAVRLDAQRGADEAAVRALLARLREERPVALARELPR